MFGSSNDCFTSSSGLIFNRHHHHHQQQQQHHTSRYHPYHRIATSSSPSSTTAYYPSTELEPFPYDHPSTIVASGTVQNFDEPVLSYDYSLGWTSTSSGINGDIEIIGGQTGGGGGGGGGGVGGAPRCFKRRVSANKKERRRTQSINTAFSDLRTAIPNVQPDTKLSKIKTLKLATKYIEFLMDILDKNDPTAMPSAFKADIIKTRKDHRDLLKFENPLSPRKIKGRTGWPQAVWQSELNRNENFHHQQQHSPNVRIRSNEPPPPPPPPLLYSDNGIISTASLSNSPTLSHTSSSSNSTKSNLSQHRRRQSKCASLRSNTNNEKMRMMIMDTGKI